MAELRERFRSLRSLLVVALIVAALLALAVVPSRAAAASYTLRPNATLQIDPGWSVTPSTLTADVALAAPVTQVATPITGGANLTASAHSRSVITTTVGVAAPTLAANETPSGATAWVYASTGVGQPLTISLQAGSTTIASGQVGANKPAAWISVTASGPLGVTQLDRLAISLTKSGGGEDDGTTVYAAYVALTTTVAGASGASGKVGETDDEGGTGGGGAAAGGRGGGSRPSGAFAPSLAPPAIAAPSQPVVVRARATAIPIALACPVAAVGGCHGTLTLTLSVGSGAHPRAVAVIARCGRGCRTIGKAPFNVARGQHKQVRVPLAIRGRRLFGAQKQITVTATTVVHDRGGRAHSKSAQMILQRG